MTRSCLLARHVFDVRGIKWAALLIQALLIQALYLIIQLNIIRDVVAQMGENPALGYVVALTIGVVFYCVDVSARPANVRCNG